MRQAGASFDDGTGRRPFRVALPSPRRLWRAALDFLLPPHCPGCGARTMEPATLCGACWAELRFIERPFCERTATPFSADPGPGALAPEAIQFPPAWERARAAVLYSGSAPALARMLKYGDRQEVAPLMGRLMARAGADILATADLIVPVPMHRARLWSRRFNQAVLLAGIIAKAARKPLRCDLVRRRKATPPQVGLAREARLRNLAGAFIVPKAARAHIAGRSIVLVDDVLTTGATLSTLARVLKRAGARRVDVLVFARVSDVIAAA